MSLDPSLLAAVNAADLEDLDMLAAHVQLRRYTLQLHTGKTTPEEVLELFSPRRPPRRRAAVGANSDGTMTRRQLAAQKAARARWGTKPQDGSEDQSHAPQSHASQSHAQEHAPEHAGRTIACPAIACNQSHTTRIHAISESKTPAIGANSEASADAERIATHDAGLGGKTNKRGGLCVYSDLDPENKNILSKNPSGFLPFPSTAELDDAPPANAKAQPQASGAGSQQARPQPASQPPPQAQPLSRPAAGELNRGMSQRPAEESTRRLAEAPQGPLAGPQTGLREASAAWVAGRGQNRSEANCGNSPTSARNGQTRLPGQSLEVDEEPPPSTRRSRARRITRRRTAMVPPEAFEQFLEQWGLTAAFREHESEVLRWADWHRANGSLKADWAAAWRSWTQNWNRYGYPRNQSHGGRVTQTVQTETELTPEQRAAARAFLEMYGDDDDDEDEVKERAV